MQSISADARGAHVARRSCVERLLRAIGYPDRAPEAALSFTLLVDGVEIVASEEDGRLRLVCRLTDDAAHLPRSASHERIGMFCHHLIGAPHFGQCDGGETIDSPRGARQMTTLRNEAMHAPNQNEKKPSMAISAGSFLIVPRAAWP